MEDKFSLTFQCSWNLVFFQRLQTGTRFIGTWVETSCNTAALSWIILIVETLFLLSFVSTVVRPWLWCFDDVTGIRPRPIHPESPGASLPVCRPVGVVHLTVTPSPPSAACYSGLMSANESSLPPLLLLITPRSSCPAKAKAGCRPNY